MHPLDWAVIIVPLVIILTIGLITRHMKSVAHFVSGGRYLFAVAMGEMQAGAVVFVAAWEVFATPVSCLPSGAGSPAPSV